LVKVAHAFKYPPEFVFRIAGLLPKETPAVMELSFGSWLQSEMNKKHLSQADVARLTGMTTGGVSFLINETRKPSPDTLNAIAHAFKYPPEFVFRIAGLLPKETPTDEELEFLFSQLQPDEQDEIKEIVRMKLNRRGGKTNGGKSV
jgi:transcriptional regulator with XRE-family HTH domain